METKLDSGRDPSRKKLQELLLLYLVYVIVYEGCLYGLGILLPFLSGRGVSETVCAAAALCGISAGALLSLFIVLKRTGQKPAVLYAAAFEYRDAVRRPAAVVFDLSAGLLLALSVNLLFILFRRFFSADPAPFFQPPAIFGIRLAFIPSLLLFGFLMPFCEEAFFRGILFRESARVLPFIYAAVFSSLLFSVYHGNLSQGIYAFIMGLYFCRLTKRYGSVRAPFMQHVLVNTAVLFLSRGSLLQTAISFLSTVE